MATILSSVRVTVSAENMLAATPIANVTANPVTKPVPKRVPNQKRMAHVINVDTLLSLIAGHALLNPVSMDAISVLPLRSSSFMRSNINILASTAMPMDSINAANPPRVNVMGHSFSTANTNTEYITNAMHAYRPGNL